jgi:hypothetical protein
VSGRQLHSVRFYRLGDRRRRGDATGSAGAPGGGGRPPRPPAAPSPPCRPARRRSWRFPEAPHGAAQNASGRRVGGWNDLAVVVGSSSTSVRRRWMSVLTLGYEVGVRPPTTPASTSVDRHDRSRPQVRLATKLRAKAAALSFMRSSGVVDASRQNREVVIVRRRRRPCDRPECVRLLGWSSPGQSGRSDTSCRSPASSRASCGCVSSVCSTPSVASMAAPTPQVLGHRILPRLGFAALPRSGAPPCRLARPSSVLVVGTASLPGNRSPLGCVGGVARAAGGNRSPHDSPYAGSRFAQPALGDLSRGRGDRVASSEQSNGDTILLRTRAASGCGGTAAWIWLVVGLSQTASGLWLAQIFGSERRVDRQRREIEGYLTLASTTTEGGTGRRVAGTRPSQLARQRGVYPRRLDGGGRRSRWASHSYRRLHRHGGVLRRRRELQHMFAGSAVSPCSPSSIFLTRWRVAGYGLDHGCCPHSVRRANRTSLAGSSPSDEKAGAGSRRLRSGAG